MRFFKFLLWKAYFDRGWGLLNQVKYGIVLLGLYESVTAQSIKITIVIGFIYCFACLIAGRLWFKYKLIETENEIDNIFNPFQKEVRNYMENGKVFKPTK